MQTLGEIRSLLAGRGLRPNHRLGQCFLHDHGHLRRLVNSAGLAAGDRVLEIGPGTGVLTELLLERGASVIACEVDAGLAQLLRDRIGDRVRLVEGDCLGGSASLHPEVSDMLGDEPFKLVANLPFQVAGRVIGLLLTHWPTCDGLFVTIQKEVAERLRAQPGSKDFGPLAVLAQSIATIEYLATLSPGCFWPSPDVTSAMVAIRRREIAHTGDAAGFSTFLRDIFSTRRKQLGTILGRDFSRWPDGVSSTQRPETLTVEQLVAIFTQRNKR